MAGSASDYAAALAALLPRGPYWDGVPDDLAALFSAVGGELARLDIFFETLIKEADPTQSEQLMSLWEREFGLSDGSTLAPDSRRNRLSAAIFFLFSGGSLENYVKVKGYTLSLGGQSDYPATRVGDTVGGYTSGYLMTNRITVSFSGNYTATEKAAILDDLNKYKPAHTILVQT